MKDKNLEQLIEDRESLVTDIEKYINDNLEVFGKNYSNESVMQVPSDLFFKMYNNLVNTSMQYNLLVGSVNEFIDKLQKAVITSDLIAISLRKEVLEQIKDSVLLGELKEKNE